MRGPRPIRRGTRASLTMLAALMVLAAAGLARAQQADRTIEEIKTESLARAERGAYPLGGLDIADVRDALAMITARDPDAWGAAWSSVADRYRAKAEAAASPAEADANYLRAWRLYAFGHWPAPTSPAKAAAYQHAVDAYLH